MDIWNELWGWRRHTRLILLLCLGATIAAAGLSYLMADSYVARALVLVRPDENINIATTRARDSKELLNFPVTSVAPKVETPSNTYIEVIKSRAVAGRVVRMLNLDVETETVPTTAWERMRAAMVGTLRSGLNATVQILRYGKIVGKSTRFDEAVERVQNHLSLAAIKDTYLFEISSSDSDPKTAAAVANSAAIIFLAYMAELNLPEADRTLQFLSKRLHESEEELARARRAFREFKEAHQTISFKEETTEGIKIVAELESALEKTEAKLAGLTKELTPEHPKVESVAAERQRLLDAFNRRKQELPHLSETERQLTALQLNIQVAEDLYQLIKKEHEQARLRVGKQIAEIKVVSPAVPPTFPAKPTRIIYVLVAAVVSFGIGTGWALVREQLDTTIRNIHDVDKVLQLRVLATLPPMRFTSTEP